MSSLHAQNYSVYRPRLTTAKTISVALALTLTSLGGWVLNKTLDPNVGLADTPALEKPIVMPAIRPLSAKQALGLFDALADDVTIPYIHPDGCFARAERMRELIESRHLHAMKIWAFEDEDHHLYFREAASKGGYFMWHYHVAVALPVSNAAGQTKLYVYDPKVFDAPAEMSEWAERLHADPKALELTEPDAVPQRYRAMPGPTAPKIYTKEMFANLITREFNHYRNQGDVRSVYPTELRAQICARQHDGQICKTRGVTWRVVSAPKQKTSWARALGLT